MESEGHLPNVKLLKDDATHTRLVWQQQLPHASAPSTCQCSLPPVSAATTDHTAGSWCKIAHLLAPLPPGPSPSKDVHLYQTCVLTRACIPACTHKRTHMHTNAGTRAHTHIREKKFSSQGVCCSYSRQSKAVSGRSNMNATILPGGSVAHVITQHWIHMIDKCRSEFLDELAKLDRSAFCPMCPSCTYAVDLGPCQGHNWVLQCIKL